MTGAQHEKLRTHTRINGPSRRADCLRGFGDRMNFIDKTFDWIVEVLVNMSTTILEWQGWKLKPPPTIEERLAESRAFHATHIREERSPSPDATYTVAVYVPIPGSGKA